MNNQNLTSEKSPALNYTLRRQRLELAQSVLRLRPHTTIEEIDELWQYISSIEPVEYRDVCLCLLPAAFQNGNGSVHRISIETLDRFFRWVQEGIIPHRRTTI